MTREMLAAAVLVWLIGALAGWFVGWAARGEQNRNWHAGVRLQLEAARAELEQTRAQLADALDELQELHGARADRWHTAAARVPTTVVAVHQAIPAAVTDDVAVVVPGPDSGPVPGAVMPVVPAQGAQS